MSHAKMKADAVQQFAEQFKTGSISLDSAPAKKSYDLAVIIGRFEPYHVGHQILVNKALMMADHVLVLIGSSNSPRTIKNPFTFDERTAMILESLPENLREQSYMWGVHTRPLVDNLYSDDEWISSVQSWIRGALHNINPEDTDISYRKVAIVGNKKDESSYYLDLFPQYDSVFVDEVKLGFDATAIREVLFEKPGFVDLLQSLVPTNVFAFFKEFMRTAEYIRLQKEYFMIKKYKESWKAAPYPPTFVTADAVVKKAGHILLVKRKHAPGEGLWALPGGFVEQHQRVEDAAFDELDQETCIDVPPAILRSSMGPGVVFDHPGRSLRGRTITHAFLFDLDKRDSKKDLPKVRGADDASEAKWFAHEEVLGMADKIFEDHLSIIRRLAGI